MTVDDLVKVYCDAFYAQRDKAPEKGITEADRAGVTAIVRALRDEIVPDGEWWDHADVKGWFNEILGDAGEKVAECSSVALSPTPATDAAPAVCEWQMAGFNWDKRWPQCDPTSGPMFVTYRASIPQKCPLCFRPIKFTEAK